MRTILLLDVSRCLENFLFNTAVKLDSLEPNPLLSDDGDDVVPPHDLVTLLTEVVDAQVYVGHSCGHNADCLG